MLVQVSELAQGVMTYLGMPTPVFSVSNREEDLRWGRCGVHEERYDITPSAGCGAPFGLVRSP